MTLEATMYYLMEQLARERQHTMLKEAEANRLVHRVRQERRAQKQVARLEAAVARGASLAGLGGPARGRSE